MSRHFRAFSVTLLLAAAFFLAACQTPYTAMYSPRRNYFTPVKEEQPKAIDILPPPLSTGGGATLDTPPPPSLPALPPPEMPEEPMAEPPLDSTPLDPAEMEVPAIPGL